MDKTEKQKCIHIYKVLGSQLRNRGNKFSKKAFNLKPIKVSKTDIKNALIRNGFKKWIYNADHDYFCVDWKTWQSIIFHDWTNKRKYVAEKGDCDDFAGIFKNRMSEIYGLNSVALGRGTRVYDKNTNKLIAVHRHNIIIAIKGGVYLEPYIFEAQNDGFVLLEKGVPIIIKNWRYSLDGWIDF